MKKFFKLKTKKDFTQLIKYFKKVKLPYGINEDDNIFILRPFYSESKPIIPKT
jgi:hypothetical protein